ncbi:MAG: hypothetical protein JSR41_05565 [Proteobacteria bacterium]|nr:hypothetical protein [Pseudomonadota bacterium]
MRPTIAPPIRRHPAVVLGLALTLLLGACGDRRAAPEAGSAPDGALASPASSAAPARYLLARAVNEGAAGRPGGRSTLYVVDPAKPSPALHAIDLGVDTASPYGPPIAGGTQAYRMDRAARRSTYAGQSVALFVKDGKVFKVELRADLPHAPTQVSSLGNACRLARDMVIPTVSADGRDAWFKVDTAGPGGNCAYGSTAAAYVRTTMDAGAPALEQLPGEWVDALDDGAHNTLAYLMLAPEGLVLYDVDLRRRIGAVQGGGGVRKAQLMGFDYSAPQAHYYRVDDTVRHLRWDAKAATLSPSLLPLTRPDFGPRNVVGHADLQAFYFGDGNRVFKVAGGGPPVQIATVAGLPVYAIMMTDTHLVVWQADPARPTLGNSATVVAKSDGRTTVSIEGATPVGATATRMVYLTRRGAEHRTVAFDGQEDAALAAGPAGATLVFAPSRVADLQYLEAAVGCAPAPAAGRPCEGRIVQRAIGGAEGSELVIGAVPPGAAARLQFVDPTFGVELPLPYGGAPALLTIGNTLHVWTPGQAGSLAQVGRTPG